MRILFCTSQLPGAITIRSLTWSDWSHVALIDGDEVIEAVWPKVRITSLTEVISKHSSHAIIDFPNVCDLDIINAARSQVGKPYDLVGILGISLHRNWQEQDKWFCSELVAWAFDKAGYPLFRVGTLNRVVPQHLWMLLPSRDLTKDLVNDNSI